MTQKQTIVFCKQCWPVLPGLNKRGTSITFFDALFFEKIHKFKAAILLFQSSLECENFLKLKETQVVYLVIKLTKPFACTRWKTKRGISFIFFELIITLLEIQVNK